MLSSGIEISLLHNLMATDEWDLFIANTMSNFDLLPTVNLRKEILIVDAIKRKFSKKTKLDLIGVTVLVMQPSNIRNNTYKHFWMLVFVCIV